MPGVVGYLATIESVASSVDTPIFLGHFRGAFVDGRVHLVGTVSALVLGWSWFEKIIELNRVL